MSKQGKSRKPGKKGERDQAVCVFGAELILKHLESLNEEASGLRAGEKDIEFIHRTRVATRRLRAAIPMFERCFPRKKIKTWKKEIRAVTQALGAARDADVQIERVEKISETLAEKEYQPGIERLLLRLRQERQRVQPAVDQAAAGLIESNLIEEMMASLQPQASRAGSVYIYTPALYLHSFQSIYPRLEAFLAYQSILYQPEKVTELHEMRIAAKWLRYTIEAFAPLYSNQLKPAVPAARKIQDLLGDIHDSDVWMTFLAAFLEQERQRTLDYFGDEAPYQALVPGIAFFMRELQQTREATYQDLMGNWQQWQEEQVWEALLKTIQSPFFQVNRFYPPLQQVEQA